MKDLHFYGNIAILLLNIIALMHISMEGKYNFKGLRVIILIAVIVGLLDSINQVTWVTLIFSFCPALSLIKIKPHANIFHKLRAYFRRGKQSLQDMERSGEALHKQT